MQGKVADDATEIVWKSYQTYQDGSVVEWVGAQDAEKPASVTTVKPSDGSAHGHGAAKTKDDAATEHQAKEDVKSTTSEHQAEESTTNSSNAPLYVSIAALVAGLLALGISLKKRA